MFPGLWSSSPLQRIVSDRTGQEGGPLCSSIDTRRVGVKMKAGVSPGGIRRMESSFALRGDFATLLFCVQDSSPMGSLVAVEQLFVEKMVRVPFQSLKRVRSFLCVMGCSALFSTGLMSALPSRLYCRRTQARLSRYFQERDGSYPDWGFCW